MRSLALVVAIFIMLIGVAGVLAPDSFMTLARYAVTPIGLYVIAAVRVGIGLVLILAAAISRASKTLRALGAVALVAGLTTPFLGAERARAILDWQLSQGTILLRVGAGLALAIGGFIAFAVAAGRREPRTGAAG
ncbi:MAG TPA: hypothetical protein VN375_06855 [Vicinamibacteria bacterium]|jgi:hypothetical protein|nr:hypothetical protein [Vicinamibacteria bacterium]